MSVWSGFAAAGIGIVLLLAGATVPIWEVRFVDPSERTSWSYRMLAAQNEVVNPATGETVFSQDYPYAELASTQRNMSRVFSKFQLYVALGALAAIVGMALSAVTRWKRVPGVFAGVAFAGASASIIYAVFEIVFAIPSAAGFDIDTRIFQVSGRIDDNSMSWGPDMGLYLPIASGLAFAWASSDVWHLRPARKAAPMRVEAVRKVNVPPPPVDAPRAVPSEPSIEEVFVIGSNGLLIKHMSRTLMTDKDRDVVGSMISAISSFVREAFSERDGEVHEVSLGEHRFIMCNEKGIVVAVLATHGEAEDIVPRLRHLLTLLFDRYGQRLMRWQGEPLEGIEDELHVLWEPFHLPPPPAE